MLVHASARYLLPLYGGTTCYNTAVPDIQSSLCMPDNITQSREIEGGLAHKAPIYDSAMEFFGVCRDVVALGTGHAPAITLFVSARSRAHRITA